MSTKTKEEMGYLRCKVCVRVVSIGRAYLMTPEAELNKESQGLEELSGISEFVAGY